MGLVKRRWEYMGMGGGQTNKIGFPTLCCWVGGHITFLNSIFVWKNYSGRCVISISIIAKYLSQLINASSRKYQKEGGLGSIE